MAFSFFKFIRSKPPFNVRVVNRCEKQIDRYLKEKQFDLNTESGVSYITVTIPNVHLEKEDKNELSRRYTAQGWFVIRILSWKKGSRKDRKESNTSITFCFQV